mmetsp:Transcript_10474/g.31999  ORF Transcript_10474/g.31999 Transcript_10474/m.31999 type:complete len:288 (-) Transcript_10474:781-1644(-)
MSTSKVDEKQGETEGLTEEHAPKSIEEVVDWLKDIKKGEYIDVFKKNEIDGDILLTLTSEEMRDDLGIHNLRHRRELLDAINVFVNAKSQVEMLPEHGRILDHLSNVRTFHSWVRVGVQLLAFALISLRLYPVWREQKPIVTSFSLYYSVIGTLAIMVSSSWAGVTTETPRLSDEREQHMNTAADDAFLALLTELELLGCLFWFSARLLSACTSLRWRVSIKEKRTIICGYVVVPVLRFCSQDPRSGRHTPRSLEPASDYCRSYSRVRRVVLAWRTCSSACIWSRMV